VIPVIDAPLDAVIPPWHAGSGDSAVKRPIYATHVPTIVLTTAMSRGYARARGDERTSAQ
jgi:hypothetical protein